MVKSELARLRKKTDILRGAAEDVMAVKECMTREVVTGELSISILDAARMMEEKDISSIVITGAGLPIGIVTERDLVRKTIIKGTDPHESVAAVMTRGLVTITKKTKVTAATALMIEKGIRRLPVVEDRRLVGIITATDILNLF